MYCVAMAQVECLRWTTFVYKIVNIMTKGRIIASGLTLIVD